MRWITPAVFWTVALAGLSVAAEKKALTHDDYDKWKSLVKASVSPDGKWFFAGDRDGKGKSTLYLRQIVGGSKKYSFPRGTGAFFTADSSHVALLIAPDAVAVKKAKAAKKKPEEIPQPALVVINLKTGKRLVKKGVRGYKLPRAASGYLAYQMALPTKAPAEPKKETAPKPKPGGEKNPPKAKKSAKGPKPAENKGATAKKKKKKKTGSDLYILDLKAGKQLRLANVTEYTFTRDGKRLAAAVRTLDDNKDGVIVVTLKTRKPIQVAAGEGRYKSPAWDYAGEQLAFLTDRDDQKAKKPAYAVYRWQVSAAKAEPAVTAKTPGVPKGHVVAGGYSPSFSHSGGRLFFGLAPVPKAAKKKKLPSVKVDIWHWKDDYLQPMQLVRARRPRPAQFTAVQHIDSGKAVAIGDAAVPSFSTGDRGDADFAVANDNKPYRRLISWDSPPYYDIYVADVKTGERRKVLTRHQSSARMSPGGKYLITWDTRRRAYYAVPTNGGKMVNLTSAIAPPLADELNDRPMPASAYGVAGWLKDDAGVLIYDRYDIWLADPRGVFPPTCVTDKLGRKNKIRFRYQRPDTGFDFTNRTRRPDTEERFIPGDRPIVLSAFNEATKASGYYADIVRGTAEPKKLIMLNERVASLAKAKKADRVIYVRSTFRNPSDLWTSPSLKFAKKAKLTDVNPQQKDYRWGTAELVKWTSLDGTPLTGVLYKPDGFDAKKKYPMMVYFYERLSDRLHRYVTPNAGTSINISFYVSRGYVVFTPDIPYRVGAPGQSCVNAVLPGVAKLIEAGFIDKGRVGVQGHSWGGYQITYLVTRTDLFAAAEAGAPVSNMTSAYGGIRWGSGMSRMFQYERTQSRIGGTLWTAQQKYIENSPVFWADRVRTPLLILHNDKDGAVPWYQGIEMFVAMRRLNKPCWMVNYNGADHGLRKSDNRKDWTVRMQQFFDHYLKGAKPPVWLAEGVPAAQKGKTLGLDLVK